jgi:hypothetical protein
MPLQADAPPDVLYKIAGFRNQLHDQAAHHATVWEKFFRFRHLIKITPNAVNRNKINYQVLMKAMVCNLNAIRIALHF